DHRMLRERQILETLGGGPRAIPDIVKIIYADVSNALHRMAAMSVHSHLRKLKAEGRVSEETVAGRRGAADHRAHQHEGRGGVRGGLPRDPRRTGGVRGARGRR